MTLILVVDDDELVTDMVRAGLENAGYTVGTLSDGRGALQIIEFKKPALVLLDCSMPHVPGVEVLRRIRASRLCFDVPVLMLTARSNPIDRDIAMRAGATGYLCKPFDLEHLVLRVEEVINDARLGVATATTPTNNKRVNL